MGSSESMGGCISKPNPDILRQSAPVVHIDSGYSRSSRSSRTSRTSRNSRVSTMSMMRDNRASVLEAKRREKMKGRQSTMSTLENPDWRSSRFQEQRRDSVSDRNLNHDHDQLLNLTQQLSITTVQSGYSGSSSFYDKLSMRSVNERESKLSHKSSKKSIKVVPLRLPDATIDDFNLIEQIGQGVLGKVYKVTKKQSDTVFAMKLYHKYQVAACAQSNSIKNEKAILSHLNHPCIVRVHYSFKTEDEVCLVEDYLGNIDLLRLIDNMETLSPDHARFYAANIVLAVDYLHTKKILHRDLKSTNLMINSDGYLKLIDFGNAKISNGKTRTICGTAYYMAPEMAAGKRYGRAADWWSVGIILYEMLHGLNAFEIKDTREDATKIYEIIGSNKISFNADIDNEARDLIKGLLKVDTKQRLEYKPNTQRYIVTQSYFEEVDFEAVYNKTLTPPSIPLFDQSMVPLGRNSARRKSIGQLLDGQLEAPSKRRSNFECTFDDY